MNAFLALLARDLTVAWRGARVLLAGILPQPILVGLVFANLLPHLGLIPRDFGAALVPGLVGVAILVAGVQGVLAPLAADLAGAREIDERLLAPLGTRAVAWEKILAGGLQAAAAGLIVLPVLMLITRATTQATVSPAWPVLVPLIVLAGLLSGALGLMLGAATEPRQSGLVFALVAGPMMLFGCAYYPFAALQALGVWRYLFLLNPMVFVCEALRLGATPTLPHMPVSLLLPGLLAWVLLLGAAGAARFERRVIQ